MKHFRTQMLILQKRCCFDSALCWNSSKRCSELQFVRAGYPHVHIFMYMMGKSDYAAQHAEWFLCKGIIHCSQRGQPSHAAVEGEGRIILHHQLCITKSN